MSTDEIVDKKKQEIDQLNKKYRRLTDNVRNLMKLENALSNSTPVEETISLLTQRIQGVLKIDPGVNRTGIEMYAHVLDAYAHVIEALVAYKKSKNI